MKKLIKLFTLLFSIAAVVVIISALYVFFWFSQSGPLEEDAVVMIPPGIGFQGIAEELAEHNVVSDRDLFMIGALMHGGQSSMKAGEYEFAAHISPVQVLNMLIKGDSVVHAITIPEGLTSNAILTLIAQDPRMKGKITEGIEDGVLMPNTYHFHRGDQRADLIKRMKDAMQGTLDELWEKRTDGLPISSQSEVLILASIVEKETGVDQERGKVASVFVNRLNKGMLLQSDPTVVYGIEKASGPMNRKLLRKDLAVNHPHNTYLHKGLPPSPIANPGRAAIEAVLNPPVTDYYYFVATGRGGHYFGKTLAEHNQNVVRYKSELSSQRAR